MNVDVVRRFTSVVALAVGGLAILGASCARRGDLQPSRNATDPKLSISSYIEEGNLVGLVVASKIARVKAKRELMPVEIAVANIGLPSLTLTAESFTLVDESGRRYQAASQSELRAYGSTDADRRLMELPPVVLGRWNNYNQVVMNFTRSFDEPTVTDPLLLARFAYGIDILYFPRPDDGVLGKGFELHLAAPELEDPVFVKFAVAP